MWPMNRVIIIHTSGILNELVAAVAILEWILRIGSTPSNSSTANASTSTGVIWMDLYHHEVEMISPNLGFADPVRE